jgi:hypothetical protein
MPKPSPAPIGALLVVMLVALGSMARTDSFSHLRTVDVVRLFGAGMAAGVALFQMVRLARER